MEQLPEVGKVGMDARVRYTKMVINNYAKWAQNFFQSLCPLFLSLFFAVCFWSSHEAVLRDD